MSWAEVSRINSDLSTPLNEFIENKMRYVSSDNIISVVASDATASTSETTHLNKSMKHSGVLSVALKKPTTLSMSLYIYKNNEKIATISADAGSNYTLPFEFEKNDIIKITTEKNSGSGRITQISLRGMVAFGDF